MSENPVNALAVYELHGSELRKMVMGHAVSAFDCAKEVQAALDALPPDADEGAPVEKRRSAVYQGAIETLKMAEDEARYLYDHIPIERHFMLTATQLLAFRKRWGRLVVDVERLAWAPNPSMKPNLQAERSLDSAVIQTPRIVLPDGSLRL